VLPLSSPPPLPPPFLKFSVRSQARIQEYRPVGVVIMGQRPSLGKGGRGDSHLLYKKEGGARQKF